MRAHLWGKIIHANYVLPKNAIKGAELFPSYLVLPFCCWKMKKCSEKNKYRFSVSKRKSKEIYHFFLFFFVVRQGFFYFIFILRALTYKYDNNSKFIKETYFCNKDNVFFYFILLTLCLINWILCFRCFLYRIRIYIVLYHL